MKDLRLALYKLAESMYANREELEVSAPFRASIRIAELETENERLRKDAERWWKHGPVLIEIIGELVGDAVDLGSIGEATQARIADAIDAMEGGE